MFAMIGKMKVLAVAAIAATGLAAGAQKASAHDHFSFGLSFAIPVYAPPLAPAPVYAAPAPACPAPAPTVVYAQPPVVVYQPAPVYYRPYYGYYHGWEHREWEHRERHH